MGCWNGTCAISNLPILAGEKVKVLFLHRPYGSVAEEMQSSAYCYPNGIFHVGAFAFDAEYDDYGGIEDIKQNVNTRAILKYFKTKYSKMLLDEEEYASSEFDLEQIIKGIERGIVKVFPKGQKGRDFIDATYNFVMIRKDVWDGICAVHEPQFFKDKEDRKHAEDYYVGAEEWVAKRFKKYEETLAKYKGKLRNDTPKDKKIDMQFLLDMMSLGSPLSADGYAGGNSMFMRGDYDKILTKNVAFFKKAMVEFLRVENFMSHTRKGWMPVSGAGSQSSDWGSYMKLNKIVDDICKEKLKEEGEDE